MYELIADLLRIVIDSREADVAFVVHPDDQRVEVGNEHPLSNIELSLKDDKRVLDVLLGDPKGLLAFHVVLDLYEVVVAGYTSASRKTRRLQDPNVVVACEVILMRKSLLVFGQELFYFLEELVVLVLLLLVLDNLVLWLILTSLSLLFLLLFLLLRLLHAHASELAIY